MPITIIQKYVWAVFTAKSFDIANADLISPTGIVSAGISVYVYEDD